MTVYINNTKHVVYLNGKKVKRMSSSNESDYRILEDGSYRINEVGDRRILE